MARFLAALCSCFSQHAPEPKAEKAPGDALHEGLIAICGKDFVAFEGGDSYGTWLTSYNRDKPMLATPHAIVRPRTAKEVADVVKLAASASCKVQPKSGGHSFA